MLFVSLETPCSWFTKILGNNIKPGQDFGIAYDFPNMLENKLVICVDTLLLIDKVCFYTK